MSTNQNLKIELKIAQIRRFKGMSEQAEELIRQLAEEAELVKQELAELLCPFSVGDIINLPLDQPYRSSTKGIVIAIRENGIKNYYVHLNPVGKDGGLLKAAGYSSTPWGGAPVEEANAEYLATKNQ